MKKFLAIMLGVVLCLGVVLMTGCGAFDGNYKEVKAEDLARIVEQVEKSEDGKDLNISKYGFQIKSEGKIETTLFGVKMEESGKVELKTAIVDGKCQMISKIESKTKADSKDVKLEEEMYLVDEVLYSKTVLLGTTTKIKIQCPNTSYVLQRSIESGLSFLGDNPILKLNFSKVFAQYKNSEDAKFFIDETDKEFVKVKISIGQKEKSQDGEIIFLFDKTAYALKGFKLTYKQNSEGNNDGTKMEIEFEASPFSGSLSFPNDLDSYKESLL